jgi:hypothetical protein
MPGIGTQTPLFYNNPNSVRFLNYIFCTVKAGNFVTFFAQINFFLKNALR